MGYGMDLSLITQEQYKAMQEKYAKIDEVKHSLHHIGIRPGKAFDAVLNKRGLTASKSDYGKSIAAFLRRPEITIGDCLSLLENQQAHLTTMDKAILEMEIKYEGYIKREMLRIKQRQSLQEVKLPRNFNYENILGLKNEAKEKLNRFQPLDLGSASRISGVDGTDIDLIHLHIKGRKKLQKHDYKY